MTAPQHIRQLLTTDTPSFEEVFAALRPFLPLLDELENTPQDALWHTEGNVRIHTEMVFHEINTIIKEHDCTEQEVLILRTAALLHDIAKPITTRYDERDGRQRIVSPHHADKGRSYCASRLIDLFDDTTVWRSVLALIGHHHDILPLSWKNHPQHLYLRVARHVSPRLLYFLERADTRGRICNDQNEGEELVEMFRLFAHEYNLWDCPTPYRKWEEYIHHTLVHTQDDFRRIVVACAIRDMEAGIISTPEEAVARSYHQRQPFSQMVVLCGVSGSGKSTYREEFYADYHCICLDEIRERIAGKRSDQSMNGQVLQAAQEELRCQLRIGNNVVWDATNLNRELRNAIIQLGMNYGAFVHLVAFVLPEKEIMRRNAQRKHDIPTTVLQQQLQRYDLPYLHEAHSVEFIRSF